MYSWLPVLLGRGNEECRFYRGDTMFASMRNKISQQITALTLMSSLLLLCGCAHHPVDCAVGFAWADCLPGTPGYVNGAGQTTRENETKDQLNGKNAQPESPKDVYTELTKLDDLRKRGIITEAEFEAQKKKILNGNDSGNHSP